MDVSGAAPTVVDGGSPRGSIAVPRRVLALLPVRWWLVAGWIAQAAVRWWFAHARHAPHIFADEAGYLIAARWLTGGPATDLSHVTFYRVGYPLLLTPAYLLAHDPATVYRLVIVINCLVGALAFVLGYLWLRRFAVPIRWALPLGWVAAILPAAGAFWGQAAMADAVMPVIITGWLLALDRYLRTGQAWPAALASVLAVYAYATHARGTIVIVVHVAVLVICLLRDHRRHGWRQRGVALSAGVLLVGGLTATVANARLAAALYPDGAVSLVGIARGRLTSADGLLWSLSCADGQLWTLMISTWGLGAIGLAVLFRALLRRDTDWADRVMSGVLLATTFAIAIATSAAFPDHERMGNLAYGRYLSCLALGYLLLGVVTVIRRRATLRMIGAGLAMLLVATAWLDAYGGDRLRTWTYQKLDFPGVGVFSGGWRGLYPWLAAGILSLLFISLMLARRIGPGVLVGALLLTNLAVLAIDTMALSPSSPLPEPTVTRATGGRVAVDRRLVGYVYSVYAVRAWWTRLAWFDASDGAPAAGTCAVIVPADADRPAASWPAHPAGWTVAQGAAGPYQWAVWQAPRCPV